MKGWQLVVAALLYLWCAVDFARDKGWSDAGAWACYALANVFFCLKAAGWLR